MIKVNSQGVFMMLGGSMIKVNSPLLREILKEAFEEGRRFSRQEAQREASEAALVTVLVTRFGATAEAVKAALKRVTTTPRISSCSPAPARTSTPSTRRSRRAEASGNPEKRRDSRIVAGIGAQPQGNLPCDRDARMTPDGLPVFLDRFDQAGDQLLASLIQHTIRREP